ncbi:MAG: putative TATA-box-binding protein [Streblomastix strix]|uniref:Putative TATA-box-binding protein n=1 Tax=Streblomastix strix TaxID=222440 RepID=A0A5J4VC23_9EUKA|nr:MAG: putative TATA-box-binding protein [Streblomastix strix]
MDIGDTSSIDFQLQNVVATASLGTHVNLTKIAANARNVEFNPRLHPAALLRLLEPKATVMVYSSGSMTCTGAKSEEDALYALRKVAKSVRKCFSDEKEGIVINFKDYKIHNMMVKCNINFPVRLEMLYNDTPRSQEV